MLIRFRTNGPMDFTKYDYAIVIDTCGLGTPYPQTFATTFLNYTFSFNVGLINGLTTTTAPVLVQYFPTPSTSNPLHAENVTINPTEYTFTPNSNGQNTEFTLTFSRGLLDDPLGTSARPCSSTPLSPGSAASPAASPNALPTTQAQSKWAFNFFVIDKSQHVLDSLGFDGPTDNAYNQAVIDTTTTNANLIPKLTDITGAPSDISASIAGGEIDNTQ